MKQENPIYNEYKISRDSIHLTDAYILRCKAERFSDISHKMQFDLATQVGYAQERVSNNEINGYMKVVVSLLVKDKKQEVAQFSVECKGIFCIKEEGIDKKEQEKRIQLQIVPQLLPYVRSAMSNLSSMLHIAPIILPTMDILKSIQQNR